MDYYKEITTIVSDGSPCGKSLEDDPGLETFFFEAEGKPERFDGKNTIPASPPDWNSVEKKASKFLAQSKDLNLIVIVCQSALNRKGLDEFTQCLQGLSFLIDRYWLDLYPLVESSNGDATERVSALSNLNHGVKTLTPLRKAALAKVKGFGSVSLYDIELLQQGASKENKTKLNEEQVSAIFKESDQDVLQHLYQQVITCSQTLKNLTDIFAEKDKQAQHPDFDSLIDILTKIHQAIQKYGAVNIATDTENKLPKINNNASTATKTEQTSHFAQISSRADVEKAIDSICDYFDQNEPSSPVPLLMKRAKSLIYKDFMQIMNDLAPNGADQVRALAGIDEQD